MENVVLPQGQQTLHSWAMATLLVSPPLVGLEKILMTSLKSTRERILPEVIESLRPVSGEGSAIGMLAYM